jgi:hypothetical protein
MSLTNTRTVEMLRVQFNPEHLSEKIEAIFKDLEVLGESGQPMLFRFSRNIAVELELRFDALIDRQWDAARLEQARRFLLSLALPSRGDRLGTVDPPPVLFVWPKMYSLVGRISTPTIDHVRFARTGPSTLMIAKLAFKEILEARRTSEDMRQYGTLGAG